MWDNATAPVRGPRRLTAHAAPIGRPPVFYRAGAAWAPGALAELRAAGGRTAARRAAAESAH
eukprot:gene18211-8959_t